MANPGSPPLIDLKQGIASFITNYGDYIQQKFDGKDKKTTPAQQNSNAGAPYGNFVDDVVLSLVNLLETELVVSDTLANWIARGTNDGITVGRVVWDSTAKSLAYCFWCNTTMSLWKHVSIDPSVGYRDVFHFHGYDNASIYDRMVQVQANGGAIGNLATIVDNDQYGLMSWEIDNSTLNSRSGWRMGYRSVVFGADSYWVNETRLKVDRIPESGVDEYHLYWGWLDNVAATETTDGVYFYMDEVSGFWRCKTADSSIRTNEDSSVALVDDTHNILTTCYYDGNMYYLIDDILVATITTNIPVDVRLFNMGGIINRTGVATNTIKCDQDYAYSEFIKAA